MVMRSVLALIVIPLLISACAPSPAPTSEQRPSAGDPGLQAKKRLTVAVRGDAPLIWGGTGAVAEWVIDLFNSPLLAFDPPGNPAPLLAEAAPSIENGTWRLFPDGRMETTVRIRPGARWHDGTPVTAQDAIFGATVSREFPDLQLSTNYGSALFKDLENIDSPDDRTLVAQWRRPFAQADWLFSYLFGPPLPKHILEESYLADRASFTNLRYWSTDFVGSGPFIVREFIPSTSMQLMANDDYVLGRPRSMRSRYGTSPTPTR